jgi:hypothetical protein
MFGSARSHGATSGGSAICVVADAGMAISGALPGSAPVDVKAVAGATAGGPAVAGAAVAGAAVGGADGAAVEAAAGAAS